MNDKTSSLSILLDFDGTITMRDMGDVILDEFGLPGEPGLDDRYRRGEIGLRELWSIEVKRLQESRLDEMTEFARSDATVRPGLAELIAYCESSRIPVEVASSGLTFYILAVLEKAGLGHLPVASPALTFDGAGLGAMTFEDGIRDCSMTAMCKCERVWRQRRLGRSVLFVGDGASDNCAASQADHLMARDALARFCDRSGLAYEPFESFHDVRRFVETLVATGRA
jgi:2,3-diketo-5-methylthio-1-phosphopentane phosphatase